MSSVSFEIDNVWSCYISRVTHFWPNSDKIVMSRIPSIFHHLSACFPVSNEVKDQRTLPGLDTSQGSFSEARNAVWGEPFSHCAALLLLFSCGSNWIIWRLGKLGNLALPSTHEFSTLAARATRRMSKNAFALRHTHPVDQEFEAETPKSSFYELRWYPNHNYCSR